MAQQHPTRFHPVPSLARLARTKATLRHTPCGFLAGRLQREELAGRAVPPAPRLPAAIRTTGARPGRMVHIDAPCRLRGIPRNPGHFHECCELCQSDVPGRSAARPRAEVPDLRPRALTRDLHYAVPVLCRCGSRAGRERDWASLRGRPGPCCQVFQTGGLEGEFGAGGHAELGEYVLEVGLYGGAAHDQSFRDLRVGESLGDELHNLQLGWGEGGPPVAWSFAFSAGSSHVLDGFGPAHVEALGLGGVGFRPG